MYQVIDSPEDDIQRDSRFSIWPFLTGAILAGIVFFFVWLFSPGSPAQPGLSVESPASRDAYLYALSEPSPALRRARLLDYQRVYPDTDRAAAIIDQLDVIQGAELADWEDLTAKVYDVRAAAEEKEEALAVYETKWNGALLGGRGDELDTLRAEIDETAKAQPLPDRSLDNTDSPIPDTVPSDSLAGAPPIYAPVTFLPKAEPEPVKPPVNTDIIVQPTVRRNVSPRYPRSARRRKIEAVVIVSMHIDVNGRVALTEIISTEAERYSRDFEKAAERAAMKTRFHPKTINGKAVPAVDVRKRYIFRSSS